MARIYSYDGWLAADADAIASSRQDALKHARWIADEWDEHVELVDDEGVAWHVYPINDDGTRPTEKEIQQ